MTRRLTAIVLLLAAVAFGVDRLVSSSGRRPPQAGRSTAVATAAEPPAQPPAAPRRAVVAPLQPFQSELLHAPPALRQQLLRMLQLEQQVPRRTPRAVTPEVLPGGRTCSLAGGCSLKPCVYEADVETVGTALGTALGPAVLRNSPAPACVHPPPIRISAP